jgi:hypothetical protein
VDSIGSGQGPVAGFCDYDELSSSGATELVGGWIGGSGKTAENRLYLIYIRLHS